MSTHIAAEPGQIAPLVLLPGDPLRARWIAENFLEGATLYSDVRGMLGFSGTYRDLPVSVQGSGMGMPSCAIYAEELFNDYGVQTIIRVGSCGALQESVQLRDVILAQAACTDSQMNRLRFEGVDFAPIADFSLLTNAHRVGTGIGLGLHVGNVVSTDSFYTDRPELITRLADYRVLAVEMEAAALYTLAARHSRRALTICTVSNHLLTGEETTARERQESFSGMVELALETAWAHPTT